MIPNEDRLRDMYDRILQREEEEPCREDCEDMGVKIPKIPYTDFLNKRRIELGLEPLAINGRYRGER